MFEITQSSKNLFNGIKSNLSWRDLIGFFSLSLYLLAGVFAISTVENGFFSYDSTLMVEMARGNVPISESLSASYILLLRFIITNFSESAIVYMNLFAAVSAGLTLVWVFGRKHIFSWSGVWILLMPSYIVFNLMVWKDVLFLYVVIITVALIIKLDRDKLNHKNYFLIATIFLTSICLIRLNGPMTALLIILSFLTNGKNLRIKLISLLLSIVFAVGVNSLIVNNYQTEKSALTTKSVVIRMVENDYLFYKLCVSGEGITGAPLKGDKVFQGLPSYCNSSFVLDVVKASLSSDVRESVFTESVSLFGGKPYLWAYVKYKQSSQYLYMRGAFIFPAFVMRLDFLNGTEFKEKNIFNKMLSGWMNNNFHIVISYIFSPFWIVIFALYVVVRGIYFKFILVEKDAMQRNILVPVSLFVALYYLSLTIPSMANDTRYFLPAVFLSLFVLIFSAYGDIKLISEHVFTRNNKSIKKCVVNVMQKFNLFKG